MSAVAVDASVWIAAQDPADPGRAASARSPARAGPAAAACRTAATCRRAASASRALGVRDLLAVVFQSDDAVHQILAGSAKHHKN